ncbi:MAG: hypothetical protein KF764_22125 [Labilithrix sp.]|nr:hypothetical protein [Labilithrix sp.]MBX3219951.1 hypothetical protein [Labilithrix sp.]
MRTFRLVASALALGWILTTGSAAAEPTPPEREAARTLLLSGREKRKNGQLMGALEDFERAHAIMRVPTTGLDLGKTQQELGLLVEARTTFLEAARHPVKANESRAFKRARKEAKQLADEIAPKLATLTISVSTAARVKLDDADISSSSINVPLKVNPGKHEIVATLADDEKRETIDVKEGETKTVELTLAGAPPPPPGTGKPPPGSDEPARETSTSSLVWIGGGVAAAGLAVGAVTGLMAFGIHGDVAARCEGGTRCPTDTHADIDRGETLGTVSTVGFVVAGVGAAVLVYGLLNPQASAAKPDAASASASRPRWIAGPFGVAGTF